ncbi:hypothetical protein D9V30_01955 [Mycetocola reblochoni]|uniref:Uncharacterized protein n=2 Tax=Mycetocola reblochoni TaxID=331618 RepID=A0A1R4KB80_9MICO|nr:hypothetical protein D9V30_01955 [Mycetocola reblochoni]SJN41263.1 hypothetical protein FM119_12530 [Mycetocola reblochoni REB411]
MLKERIYLIFTTLAVTLSLASHGDHLAATEAAATLAITVAGTLLAIFVADIVSHTSAHEALPTRAELRLMMRTSFGALRAITVPIIFFAGSVLVGWDLDVAFRVSTITLIVALAVVARSALRRTTLSPGRRLLVLLAESAVGIAVVLLEVLAHG